MPAVMAPSPITATTRRSVAVARGRDRHAQRGADRGAGVADAEGVVLALGAGRKGCQAARLLDGVQPVAPTGQHLVRIGLVSHVPHQPVLGRVEDIVQRDSQLHRAQAGGEVAATGTDGLNQELAQLLRQRRQILARAVAAGRAGDSIASSSGYVSSGEAHRTVYTGAQRHSRPGALVALIRNRTPWRPGCSPERRGRPRFRDGESSASGSALRLASSHLLLRRLSALWQSRVSSHALLEASQRLIERQIARSSRSTRDSSSRKRRSKSGVCCCGLLAHRRSAMEGS